MSLTILFLDENFIIDVFAVSRFISNEQIAWEKVHVYRKIERIFLFFFLSTRDSDCYLLNILVWTIENTEVYCQSSWSPTELINCKVSKWKMLCYVMWNLFTVGSLQFPNDNTIASLKPNQSYSTVIVSWEFTNIFPQAALQMCYCRKGLL